MNIFTLPPDPLPTVGPPILPFFASSDLLPDFRRDPLQLGGGRESPSHAHLWKEPDADAIHFPKYYVNMQWLPIFYQDFTL